ncbi:alpha/beta-hydrolase [Atractiella rhizophila]|nr:alpha/beta-hydrolase [Atractiella rhizophila]
MLASEAATRGALPGLRKLVIYSSLARMRNWNESNLNLLGTMDPELQTVIYKHRAAGTTKEAEYQGAAMKFMEDIAIGIKPIPACVLESLGLMAQNPQVSKTMYGHSNFDSDGTLKNWEVADQLNKIAVPTLVVRGQFDQASAECNAPFVQNIKDVKYVVIPKAHHVAHLEFPETFTRIVQDFLV